MRAKLLCIGLVCSTAMAGACVLPYTSQLGYYSPVAVGPNVYSAVQITPAIATTIYNARNAWNVTNAADRIGDWSGEITSSDCPVTGTMQIGALPFDNDSCSVANTLGTLRDNTLAFVDPATRSVTVNLNYVWSLNPGRYDWDLQSILAHEFGHVLGLAHQDFGVCASASVPNMPSQTCAENPNRETMGTHMSGQGETCMRDLSINDINSANGFY